MQDEIWKFSCDLELSEEAVMTLSTDACNGVGGRGCLMGAPGDGPITRGLSFVRMAGEPEPVEGEDRRPVIAPIDDGFGETVRFCDLSLLLPEERDVVEAFGLTSFLFAAGGADGLRIADLKRAPLVRLARVQPRPGLRAPKGLPKDVARERIFVEREILEERLPIRGIVWRLYWDEAPDLTARAAVSSESLSRNPDPRRNVPMTVGELCAVRPEVTEPFLRLRPMDVALCSPEGGWTALSDEDIRCMAGAERFKRSGQSERSGRLLRPLGRRRQGVRPRIRFSTDFFEFPYFERSV